MFDYFTVKERYYDPSLTDGGFTLEVEADDSVRAGATDRCRELAPNAPSEGCGLTNGRERSAPELENEWAPTLFESLQQPELSFAPIEAPALEPPPEEEESFGPCEEGPSADPPL